MHENNYGIRVESFLEYDQSRRNFKEEHLRLTSEYVDLLENTNSQSVLDQSEIMFRSPVILFGQKKLLNELSPSLQVRLLELSYDIDDKLPLITKGGLPKLNPKISSLEKLQHSLFLGAVDSSANKEVARYLGTLSPLFIESLKDVEVPENIFKLFSNNIKLAQRNLEDNINV